MTQEQKARAYDEALKRARALRQEAIDKEYAIDYVKDYEAIFPELRESEDERIRKALICGLSEGLSEHNWQGFGGVTIDECLAWLEKQKEPEHICDSAQYEEGFKTGLEIGLRKQKGQKPAEWSDYKDKVNIPYCSSEPEWSEEDERILKGIIGKIDHDQTYGVSKVEMLSFLKSLRPHWKPSEEQMDALDKARRFIPYNCDILESLYKQLKKLI